MRPVGGKCCVTDLYLKSYFIEHTLGDILQGHVYAKCCIVCITCETCRREMLQQETYVAETILLVCTAPFHDKRENVLRGAEFCPRDMLQKKSNDLFLQLCHGGISWNGAVHTRGIVAAICPAIGEADMSPSMCPPLSGLVFAFRALARSSCIQACHRSKTWKRHVTAWVTSTVKPRV